MGYSTSGEFTNAERTKLANIEALADVTDSVNVDAANAVMDADFSGAIGFMEKASAGVYDLITSQELNADIIDLIRPLHPNVSILAAIDDATLSDIYKKGDNYIIGVDGGDTDLFTRKSGSVCPAGYYEVGSYALTNNWDVLKFTCRCKKSTGNAGCVRGAYKINDGSWTSIGSYNCSSVSWVTFTKEFSALVTTGDVIHYGIDVQTGCSSSEKSQYDNMTFIINGLLIGNVLTDAIAANVAVLSFFSHLKCNFSNGGSSHVLPVGVEIFGNGDAYAAALNATTKFKIDVADPRIELYRNDDSVVAKSNTQENWTLDDNGSTGAFASKTTSTHETIIGEEIGCASVVMVEKSVNGAFTDTEILVEDDDYTVDYSTRTATKIVLTTAEAADIVISQSKIRITWIADVEDIEGTANTALKMKIYLNRTANTEASPEIQKIDLGTDKYAEMKYVCG